MVFQPPLPGPPGQQIKIEESTMSPFMSNNNPNVSYQTEKEPDASTLEFNNFLESLGTNNNTSNTNANNDANEPKLL